VAGVLDRGIFLLGQKATTKVHKIRKNTSQLDHPEHPLEVEYKTFLFLNHPKNRACDKFCFWDGSKKTWLNVQSGLY
jgi:hypothetical protein